MLKTDKNEYCVDPYKQHHSEKKLTHTREKRGGVILFFFAFFSIMTFCVTYFIHSSIYHEKKKKMTINDHDQFTGLNAVHEAASEGNVKRLVELMDDGAELDVPALGGIVVAISLSLSRDFFFF